MSRIVLIAFAATLFAGMPASLRADNIRLANGDTIRGKVVAVDATHVTIETESFGKVVLPRAKIAHISLGDAPLPPAPAAGRAAAQAGNPASGIPNVKIDPKDKPQDIIRKLIPKGFDMKKLQRLGAGGKQAANPEDVIQQLRDAGGVSPELERQLSLQIPGFTSPQVHSYFDKQVNGLMSGDISLGDIRNDAVDVRDQLQALKEDLGPSGGGDALDGYLGILNGFIRDTQSIPAKKPHQAKGPRPPRPIPRK